MSLRQVQLTVSVDDVSTDLDDEMLCHTCHKGSVVVDGSTDVSCD